MFPENILLRLVHIGNEVLIKVGKGIARQTKLRRLLDCLSHISKQFLIRPTIKYFL